MPPPSPTPTVSVVLPAYNRAGTIRAAIESVLRQTWTDFELLVVDDGSADGTLEAARAVCDPRLRTLSTGRNRGPSGARNMGIREARGAWVAFQDSDDEWLPDKLALQMARLTEPGAPWIAGYCGMLIVGAVEPEAGARTKVRYIPDAAVPVVEGDILPSLLSASVISTQMLVVRRADLEAVGGFDETLPALEDWDLALRLAARGRFAFTDAPLVLQRFSPNSLTRDVAKRAAALRQIIAKHRELMAHEPEVLARHYRALAGEHRRLGDMDAARAALAEGRKVHPADARLWMLTAYLGLQAAGARLFGPSTPL